MALALALAGGASAQTYRVLKSFTGGDGATPEAGLVLAGSTLYGTTHYGGSSSNGVVFKVNTDGTGYAVLKSFTGADGANPSGGLVLVGGTLYGVTLNGGGSGCGVLFKIDTDGSGFALLKSFTPDDGEALQGPLAAANGALYGAAASCRTWPWDGLIFTVGMDGSGYAVVHACNAADAAPSGGLLLAGGTLYGTSDYSGSSDGDGTVFKVNPDGGGFAVLKSFAGTGLYQPQGAIAPAGSTLYGAAGGGATDDGVIFELSTDGLIFSVLKTFSGPDGVYPTGGLLLAGNTLYGTAGGGGNSWTGSYSGYGAVFQLYTDGTGFTVLKSFSGSDGAGPGGYLVSAGTVLYGTTGGGGSSGRGVVFALDRQGPTPPTVVQNPQSYTAAAGDSVALSVVVANIEPPAYQWVFNGTNALVGATNSLLQLTHLQPGQSGAYAVILTNGYGALTSSPARLEVIPLGTTPVASPTPGALRAALAGPGPVTFACDGTITLTNALTISSNIVVDGSGHWLTLSGGNALRVFWVSSNITFSLLNLTIADGLGTNGGAIYNDGGTVNLTNCTFVGNCSFGTNGAGIYTGSSPGGDGDGGAIFSSGRLSASLCAFLRNSATGGVGGTEGGGLNARLQYDGGPGLTGGQAEGGAIYSSGMLTVDHSLFAGNQAAGGPGGPGDPGDAGLGNDGVGRGGGGGSGGAAFGAAVFNSGEATVLNCTLAGNECLGGPGGAGASGNPSGLTGFGGQAGDTIDSSSPTLNVTNCPIGYRSGTLQATPTPAGALDISVSGAAGDTCRLLTSSDLQNWTAVLTNRLGPNGTVLFRDVGPFGQAQRFYNAVMP